MLPRCDDRDRPLTGALELDRRLERLQSELEHRRSAVSAGAPARRPETALAKLVRTTRRELERVESSLQRIAADAFGVCASCGRSVSTERLELLPHTMLCDGCAPRAAGDPLGRVQLEHTGLRRLVRSLRKFVGRAANSDSRELAHAGARHAALALLADLEQQLGKHFALEDLRGYLSAALAAAPHLSHPAAVLDGRHARFQEQVAKIVESCLQTRGGGG